MPEFAQRGFAASSGPVGWSLGAGAEHLVRWKGGPQVPGGPAAAFLPAAAVETQGAGRLSPARPCPWGPSSCAQDALHGTMNIDSIVTGAWALLGRRQGQN